MCDGSGVCGLGGEVVGTARQVLLVLGGWLRDARGGVLRHTGGGFLEEGGGFFRNGGGVLENRGACFGEQRRRVLENSGRGLENNGRDWDKNSLRGCWQTAGGVCCG